MRSLWNDVRHALQMFSKNPGFTITAVLTLVLGIGANTAIFTVVNAVLLKPLAYPDPDRIIEFEHFSSNTSDVLAATLASIPAFRVYQHQSNVFQDVAAFDFTSPGFNLTGDRPEQLQGIHVSEAYFRLFGVPMLLGRSFTPQEDAPHGGKLVVISYSLWQRKFSGDPSIVGKSLQLGHEPYTILGVVGKDFHPGVDADIWLPFQFPAVSDNMNQFFQVAARLKPGVTLQQANAQMALATAEYYRAYPIFDVRRQVQFRVAPLRDAIVGNARQSLLFMLAAVGLVLLIACANVANLLLVRATGRKRELAIRTALGASRARIIAQLLTESVLLSCAGGLLGLGIGFVGVRALIAFSPPSLPLVGNGSSIGMDWRVLLFAASVSLFTGLLFGLLPALSVSRGDLKASIKESGSRAGSGFRQNRSRSVLVVSEVSLALVLLIAAILLIRSFIALHNVTPGFDTRNVLVAEMSMTGDSLHTTAGIARLSRNARARLDTIPGVQASATTVWLPNQVDDVLPFLVIGAPPGKDLYGSRWMNFSPGYLRVFNIPVLRGRDFNADDDLHHPGVVIINQIMASRLWPHQDAIGKHLLIGHGMSPETDEPARTVVGVVGDSHNNGLGHSVDPMLMVPTAQVVDAYAAAYSDTSPQYFVLRTSQDPRSLIPAVTEQLRLASGGLPVARLRTMEEVMGNSVASTNFQMLVLAIFGAIALLLAAVGIYGLISYSVEQRAQEMGIRMALGADRASIRKLVVWQGMKLALIGVVLGLGGAFALVRIFSSFIFGIKAWDPVAFLSAPMVLSLVAMVAVWRPASRASRVDPIKAIHAE